MRKLLLAAALMLAVVGSFAQDFTIATYNLRYDNEGDKVKNNAWKDRCPHIVEIIQKNNLDFFGVQEGLFNQLADLMRAMPAYEYTGLGREGGREGEHSAIFYKRDKFSLLDAGNFWLSQTPEKLSKGWDAKYERLCSWAQLKDKSTGFTFYMFNTHFDHKGKVARKLSIALIFEQIGKIAGNAPVILSGDFNMDPIDEAYAEFAKFPKFRSAYDIAESLQNANLASVNTFDSIKHTHERIDHIFFSPDFKVSSYKMELDTYGDNKFPSDHFPIILNIQVKKNAESTATKNSVENTAAKLYPSFPEDFENAPEKTKYDRAGIKLKTGDWILDNCVIQNTANDVPSSGAYAARFIKDNTSSAFLQMDFDLPNGASKVTIAYSSYAAKADPLCLWTLEYSTDKGKTWQQTGNEVVAENKRSKAIAMFNLNIQGPVRFRINKFGLGSQTIDPSIKNGRLSIDDFAVYKY